MRRTWAFVCEEVWRAGTWSRSAGRQEALGEFQIKSCSLWWFSECRCVWKRTETDMKRCFSALSFLICFDFQLQSFFCSRVHLNLIKNCTHSTDRLINDPSINSVWSPTWWEETRHRVKKNTSNVLRDKNKSKQSFITFWL